MPRAQSSAISVARRRLGHTLPSPLLTRLNLRRPELEGDAPDPVSEGFWRATPLLMETQRIGRVTRTCRYVQQAKLGQEVTGEERKGWRTSGSGPAGRNLEIKHVGLKDGSPGMKRHPHFTPEQPCKSERATQSRGAHV